MTPTPPRQTYMSMPHDGTCWSNKTNTVISRLNILAAAAFFAYREQNLEKKEDKNKQKSTPYYTSRSTLAYTVPRAFAIRTYASQYNRRTSQENEGMPRGLRLSRPATRTVVPYTLRQQKSQPLCATNTNHSRVASKVDRHY